MMMTTAQTTGVQNLRYQGQCCVVQCSGGKGPALQGEALAHRIGFERPRAPMAERLAAVIGPEADGGADGGGSSTLRLSVSEARRLPPTVLMSSCADVTVPW
jgi:hypothetical protein